MWFTETGTGNIGTITTGGSITEYPTPSGSQSYPEGITAGPDGDLWFTEVGSGSIGKIVP